MTISQTSDYVLAHPYTKSAINSFLSGDKKALKWLIETLQIDMYQEVAELCCKAYKKRRRETDHYPQIEEAIREIAPPEKLNLRLPIPKPKEDECKIVVLRPKKPKTQFSDERQLDLFGTLTDMKKAAL